MPKLCRAMACTETRIRVASRKIHESMASSPAARRNRGSILADRKLVACLNIWTIETSTVGIESTGHAGDRRSDTIVARRGGELTKPPNKRLNAAEDQGRAVKAASTRGPYPRLMGTKRATEPPAKGRYRPLVFG
jgi:hypothetical protein